MNTTPEKKARALAFCAGSLTPQKKDGVEQEKVPQVILASAYSSYPLSTRLPTKNKNISSPVRVFLHRAVYF
jgi:hypothetical protein